MAITNETTNLKSFFADSIPGVFLDKISIGPGGPPKIVKHTNPHLDQDRLGRVGEIGSPTPQTEKDSLKSQVYFNVKTVVPKDKNIVNSWFFKKGFLDHYKILIMQVTDVSIYQEIMNTPMADRSSKILDLADKNNPRMDVDILSVYETGLINLTNTSDINKFIKKFNKQTSPDGHVIYDIPFAKNYTVDKLYPSHLSYFILPYLDDVSVPKFLVNVIDPTKTFYGTMVQQLVINDGGTVTRKRVLFEYGESGGKLMWLGPAHQMPDGSWMTYSSHRPDSKRLFEEIVDNSAIQDFRSTQKIEKKVFNFKLDDNVALGLGQLKILNNDNLDKNRKNTYFSNFFNSRDSEGNCRFFFGIDFLTLAKRNSVFSKIYESPDQGLIREALGSTLIKSLKIYRKQIHPGSLNNISTHLGGFGITDLDSNEVPILVADLNGGGTNGAIRRVNIKTNNARYHSPLMKHYTGIDISIEKSGLYRYYAEIQIQDGTIEFVERRLKELNSVYLLFKEYYNLAIGMSKYSKKKYYNEKLNNFIPDFKNELGNLSNQVGSLVGDSARRFSISKVIDTFALFASDPDNPSFGVTNAERVDFVDSMMMATDPKNGSPEGISLMVSFVSNLIRNIESIMKASSTGPTKKPGANPGASNSGGGMSPGDRTKVIKIVKEFSQTEDIFDRTGPITYGTHYMLKETSGTTFGLATFTTDDMDKRANLETSKYFINTDSVAVLENMRLDLKRAKHSFFAPMFISMGGYQETDFLKIAESPYFYKKELYDKLLTNIFRYNAGLNSEGRSTPIFRNRKFREILSVPQQNLRSSFIDFFAAKGCTVDNMKDFTALMDQDTSGPSDPSNNQNPDIDHYSEHQAVTQVSNPLSGIGSKFDSLNPNPVFSRLLKNLVLPKEPFFRPRKAFNLKSATNNVLDLVRKPGIAANIPNHIKALFGLYTTINSTGTGASMESTINFKEPIGKNDLRLQHVHINHNHYSFFFFNFANLVRVELFSGYRLGINNEAQMNAPLFTVFNGVDNNTISSAGESNHGLCRIRKYSDTSFGLSNMDELNLPIYNEYFLIKGGAPTSTISYIFDNQSTVLDDVPTAQELVAEGTIIPDAVLVEGEVPTAADAVGPGAGEMAQLQAQMEQQKQEAAQQQAANAQIIQNAISTMTSTTPQTPLIDTSLVQAHWDQQFAGADLAKKALGGFSNIFATFDTSTDVGQKSTGTPKKGSTASAEVKAGPLAGGGSNAVKTFFANLF